MDAGVAPKVPEARLASIRKLNAICDPPVPWPADHAIVRDMAKVYFAGQAHTLRPTRKYTVQETQDLETVCTRLPDPLDRYVIVTELRKLYGALRNDDAIWGTVADWKWQAQGSKGIWQGVSLRTKATEMRRG